MKEPMSFLILQEHTDTTAMSSSPEQYILPGPGRDISDNTGTNSVMEVNSLPSESSTHHDGAKSKKRHIFASILFAVTILCVICAFFSFRHGLRVWNALPSTQFMWDSNVNKIAVARKLLYLGHRSASMCTLADVAILQGETTPLPDGIPSFTVQIINLCSSGCPISDIHVSCGWFASAKLINPKLFKRVKFNDCIVNDRRPLKGGQSITFEYANSFQYPMAISSAKTCQ